VVITLVAVGLLIGACNSTPDSPTTTPTRSETVPSVPSVPTTGEPGEPATELVVSADQLEPGTYTRGDFTPRVTFALSGEWYAVQGAPGFFDVQRDVGSPHVISIQFAKVHGVYDSAGEAVPVTSAAEAAALIESNRDLTVLDQGASLLDGRDGYVLEVENAIPTETRIMQVPSGNLSIDAGRRLWIAFFDAEDGVLAIMVGGSAERWEEALLAAEPVLETVTIGD
jgi:hypothetical protein